MSESHGRLHPFVQPATETRSAVAWLSLEQSVLFSSSSIHVGKILSASLVANEHVGSAGQLIAPRRHGESSSADDKLNRVSS